MRQKSITVDVSELVINKRLRLPSQYVISTFMSEAKRRRFIDGMYPNLFPEVEHAK